MPSPRVSLFAAAVAALCAVAHAQAPAEPIRLTLVGTNDVHGWVMPHRTTTAGGATVEQGGLATFAGYIAILRKQNPQGVLLFDAGDMFQGTLASNLSEGGLVIDVYNAIGYSAAAIGNHEFDFGPVGPAAVADAGTDPFGALKERLRQARFPLLAANIQNASGGRPDWLLGDGTALLEVKGLKVGVVGLITPQTPFTTNPVNVATLRFDSLVSAGLSGAQRLRQRGADLVIAVAHAGGKCAKLDDPKDLSTCDLKTSEIFELATQVPAGTFDAIVAGHTHAALGHLVNGIPIIETWGMGRTFSLVELYVDPVTRKVLADRTRIEPAIPVCAKVEAQSQSCDGKKLKDARELKLVQATFRGAPVVKDAAVDRLIAPALAKVDKLQKKPLKIFAERMGRNYEAESALGSLFADSLKEITKADIGFMNSGGLRADLPGKSLTYGDVFEVFPFDNTIALVTLSGQELVRLLHLAYEGQKGVFQVSGMSIRLSRCPGAGRLKGYSLADGRPVEPTATYRVALPDFLALGGDGLGPLMSSLQGGKIDHGTGRPYNLRDSLIAHWQKKGRLAAPAPGRIQWVDDGATCEAGTAFDVHAGKQ